MRHLAPIHSNTCIHDPDSNLIAGTNRIHHHAAFGSIFKCILNENKQHLLQIIFASHHACFFQCAHITLHPVNLSRKKLRSTGNLIY
ncbi:hypothetical protein D3C78_1777840 [compost metagenome]